MLTRISIVTGAVLAVVNFIVLMGWLKWTTDEVAAFTTLVTVLGGMAHAWFNPDVPVGFTDNQ